MKPLTTQTPNHTNFEFFKVVETKFQKLILKNRKTNDLNKYIYYNLYQLININIKFLVAWCPFPTLNLGFIYHLSSNCSNGNCTTNTKAVFRCKPNYDLSGYGYIIKFVVFLF